MSLSAVVGTPVSSAPATPLCRNSRENYKTTICQACHDGASAGALSKCRSKTLRSKSIAHATFPLQGPMQASRIGRRDLTVSRAVEEATDRKPMEDILINGKHSWKDLLNGSGTDTGKDSGRGNATDARIGVPNGQPVGKAVPQRDGKSGTAPQEVLKAIQGSRSRLQDLIKKASHLLESDALERPVRTESTMGTKAQSQTAVRESKPAVPKDSGIPRQDKSVETQPKKAPVQKTQDKPVSMSPARPPRPSFSPKRLSRPSTPSSSGSASASWERVEERSWEHVEERPEVAGTWQSSHEQPSWLEAWENSNNNEQAQAADAWQSAHHQQQPSWLEAWESNSERLVADTWQSGHQQQQSSWLETWESNQERSQAADTWEPAQQHQQSSWDMENTTAPQHHDDVVAEVSNCWASNVLSSDSSWYLDCRDGITCADDDSQWYLGESEEARGSSLCGVEESVVEKPYDAAPTAASRPLLVGDVNSVGDQLDPVTARIESTLQSVLEEQQVWESQEKPIMVEQLKLYEMQVELLETQMAAVQQMLDANEQQYAAEIEARERAYEATVMAVNEAEHLHSEYERQTQQLFGLVDKLARNG